MMIPERSLTGRHARSVFFEDVNEIDIYIEDTAYGYEKLFSLIFSRIFDGKYKIKKVFPLGGRANVIEQHASHEETGRPYLYVIDGDLYLISGESISSDKGLYKLPFYCIENILCDPQAFSELLNEEDPVSMKENLNSLFAYNEWLVNNEPKLFRLFIEYSISFKANPEKQTVSFPVNNLVSSNDGNIDEEKLNNRASQIKQSAIDKVGNDSYIELYDSFILDFESNNLSKMDVISGKDYLFPLLKTRFKSIVKTRIPDINFKIRLAMKCDVSKVMDSQLYVAC